MFAFAFEITQDSAFWLFVTIGIAFCLSGLINEIGIYIFNVKSPVRAEIMAEKNKRKIEELEKNLKACKTELDTRMTELKTIKDRPRDD